jgi:hypothetical protein
MNPSPTKEDELKEWNKNMDNFCKAFNFGNSFLTNEDIQFMNRSFDTDKLIDIGKQQTLKDVLKIIDNKLKKLNITFARYDKECLVNVKKDKKQYEYSERQRAKTLNAIDEIEEIKKELGEGK